MSVTARSVVCNLLLNQLFVLTQHPSKHQLLSNSPERRSELVHREGAERAWTSAGLVLDLDLDWWLLG